MIYGCWLYNLTELFCVNHNMRLEPMIQVLLTTHKYDYLDCFVYAFNFLLYF